MLSIKIFCFNDFSENTFILYDDSQCLIIDPGCYNQREVKELIDFIESNKLRPISIVNTHCHIDHVLGVTAVKDHFNIPFYIGEYEQETLKSVKVYAPVYGVTGYSEPDVDGLLKDDDPVEMGDHSWKVLFVPGHCAGHIALYSREEKHCISGDVLFNRSIGRTDLPGGDFNTLINSIQDKIFTLPEDTIIYPGHGPETSVRDEKLYNPFCGENTRSL